MSAARCKCAATRDQAIRAPRISARTRSRPFCPCSSSGELHSMYESFYGLHAKPFQLRPDPTFFFGSKGHKRAMSYLEYGLSQGEGFIVITGEVGAGKTTLVRNLFRRL